MTTSRRRNPRRTGIMPPPSESVQNSGPSRSMPEPPRGWPPQYGNTSASEEHPLSSSSEEDENEDEERPEDSNSGPTESMRSRGPTLMHNGCNKDGGIIEVKVNRLGQPICRTALVLASNLGVLARNRLMAPLTYIDWRSMPDSYKDNIWKHIKENTNATNNMRDYMFKSVARKRNDWKATAKKQGYTKFKNNEDRLANRPLRVEDSQWHTLIHYWDSVDAQLTSSKNKNNRGQLTMPHTSGRNSNAQVREKMTTENGGVEPSRMDIYAKTHNKKDGSGASSQEAQKAMDKMRELKNQNPDLEETGTSQNDIFGRVFGPEKFGRVRTYGLGPTPTTLFAPSHTRITDSLTQDSQDMQAELGVEIARVRGEITDQMREREAALLAEIESMKAKDNATRAEIDALKAKESDRQMEVDAMKAKENATQAELEVIRREIRDLMAQVRSSGSSNVSEHNISSATRQVPHESTTNELQVLETPQVRKNKQPQLKLITQTQLFNIREDRIAKKSKKKLAI